MIVLLAGCQKVVRIPAPAADSDCGAAHEQVRSLRSQLLEYREFESEPLPRADVWHDRRRVIDGRFWMCGELKTDAELKLSCKRVPQ